MTVLDENALSIYTDGSSSPTRKGGVGFLFITVDDGGEPVVIEECPPGWKAATNNQMELQACIEALAIATGRHPRVGPAKYRKIVIYTDSQYVSDNYMTAIYQWSGNGWRTRDGAPVQNVSQWKELLK